MALRKIFGPKRNEVRGDYRKLYIEGLHNLHYSTNTIRESKSKRIKRTGHVAHAGGKKNAYPVVVRKA
jgi:hypothetical protein